MAIEGLFRERLGQHVGRVIVGGHPLNDDVALGDELANLEPPPAL